MYVWYLSCRLLGWHFLFLTFFQLFLKITLVRLYLYLVTLLPASCSLVRQVGFAAPLHTGHHICHVNVQHWLCLSLPRRIQADAPTLWARQRATIFSGVWMHGGGTPLLAAVNQPDAPLPCRRRWSEVPLQSAAHRRAHAQGPGRTHNYDAGDKVWCV
jgi:hypothetical protein